MADSALREGVRALLTLPRPAQIPAARALADRLATRTPDEEWNSSFGPGSLFEAWTSCHLTTGLYAANAAALRPVLAHPGFRVVEVGGGDGRLWATAAPEGARGELVLIDPSAECHDRVAAALPAGIRLRSQVVGVEDASLRSADAIVCSLTLHHLAGRDAAERARHGLTGPGKLEVLRRFRDALAHRRGLLLLNEADVYCDLQLAPGDPLLADHLADSYLRRCGRALLEEIEAREAAGDPLVPRLEAILHRWCLDQLRMADVPRAARDVYELDVFRWLELLEAAGFEVVERGFTDAHGLFHRYVCRPA
ncbi:MAG: class I SAM-dependent methyltransferase [Alphaproteobacteria bacterium]|nr:class I SAM-dependent methyltransferase [Alphaproteobacteria bacterium]MCB9796918.1 class I SAM-dependent methyltransferase [Alphaproteobacteria bacterium]